MTKRTPAASGAALVALAALLVAGCGSDDRPSGSAKQSEAPASVSASASQWRPLAGPLGRCGPQPASVQEAKFDTTTLSDPAVGSTPAVRLGTGRTVLVLLHQTDGGGLCGWLPFMPVAATAGYTTLALDLCRYGAAKCRKVDEGTFTDADQTDPVRMAVRYAREKLRARRVVVMGASMGGSVALMSGVVIDGIAAVVDLSGPLDWPGVDVARGGSSLAVPTMIAMANTEGADAVTGARTLALRAPAGSTFVAVQAGHGWDLVTDPDGVETPLAADLFAWLSTYTK